MTGKRKLVLLAPKESERAREWAKVSEPRLPAGRYLVKAYVDVNERLKRDWNDRLGAQECIGEAVVETKWPRGYSRMTTVDAPALSRTGKQ
jgi:hypothetical protein